MNTWQSPRSGRHLQFPSQFHGKRWVSSFLISLVITCLPLAAGETPTYAERLGWPKGARVVMFHSDDLGMHHDANVGTIEAIENGVVTSASAMMPCSWIPMWRDYLLENPGFDNGLHLTLTSEWMHYRWGPVAGKERVPSLVDQDGYLWRSVPLVALNATPDDVETEIRAQIAKARRMGMPVTHLDSHMGTLFALPQFLERYVKVGIEEQIPVMIMGGHMSHLRAEQRRAPNPEALAAQVRRVAEQVWDAGLPVLDDLQTDLTGVGDFSKKKAELIRRLQNIQPGVTMIIVHCTRPSEIFRKVSGSGPNRLSDTEVMTDPEIRRLIESEGIILTTWKELKERRDRVKQ
jgi:chitin disaccharide deacetylase